MCDTHNHNLYKKALYLEYFTVAYNVIEAVLAISFGAISGSISLVGFGLDSVIESLSAMILIWRLKHHDKVSKSKEKHIEEQAQKFVAVTFFVLGIYVGYQSIYKLIGLKRPDPTLPGVIIALLSLLIMPLLFWMKHKIGKQIGSKALIADAKETLVCSFLSLPLFLGLLSNYLFGWWRADPIVGLIIAVYVIREGFEVWKEAGEDE